ncbi:MAG: malectin domain-containing carbohydrate-binding protein [Terriglobia bacterium]
METVLASEIFARSPNLAKMLRYIGMKYFEGQEDAIKEYNIGVEAFGRPSDFNPKEDSIVRVEAHRLREKLKRYYELEGKDHRVVISMQVGHYIPQFHYQSEAGASSAGRALSTDDLWPQEGDGLQNNSSAAPQMDIPVRAGSIAAAHAGAAKPPILASATRWRLALVLLVLAVAAGVLALIIRVKAAHEQATTAPLKLPEPSVPAVVAAPAGSVVRIIAGYSKKDYVDRRGEIWGPDRYYSGGYAIVEPQVFIARAADPILFETSREGEFSYDIPLKPGTYELRLYFVETYYGPGTHAGGGETSRLFAINLNGKHLLTDFDIYSDAGGNDIGDVRVFRDVSPAADGKLHLSFVKALDIPVLNALEIIPTPQGIVPPIRIICQQNSYTDSEGRLWKPDRYFLRGRLATDPTRAQGTPDPGLYAEERYGDFSYAIPVAEGRYAVTLFFDETYFGPDDPGKGGVGRRVFDVDCNGIALLRDFDIFKEAGGDNRAVVRTFHGLRPNAQGKLLLSFVPVTNYASVRAIQVTDESP